MKRISRHILKSTILLFVFTTCFQTGYAQEKTSLERIAVIALKGPAGDLNQMTYSNKDKHLFLANKVNSSLDVIDVEAMQVIQQLKEDKGGSGVDYAPDHEWVFIAEGNVCNVYEHKDNQYQLLKNIPANGCSKVRYDQDNQRIYLMGRIKDKRYISVHDASTFEHLIDIDMPGRFSVFEIDRKRGKMFLNGYNALYKIDLKKNIVEEAFPIDVSRGFKPIAFDEENNRVFMATRKRPQLVIFNGETGEEIDSIDIKGDMDNIAYDPIHKRIYAACGEGFISIVQQIDADTYELIENIPTVEKARVGVFSPGMNLYFLGVQQKGDMKNQELWVYKPQ